LSGYEVINIGHPDLIETAELAEMIRARLGAPSYLLRVVDQPSRMTLVKRPALRKQATLLSMVPVVGLQAGVERVASRFARVTA
ncbi:MAG: NAD(P)-dependent oxidoreductase, partial [Elusimicrobia bacterium]|nr:NAD(P)-dependent oxidoreductase [Elusimicrobiota bacterium]